MVTFRRETGDWTRFRNDLRGKVREVDFHHEEPRSVSYSEAMDAVDTEAFESLQTAQKNGVDWIIFTHGSSTSEPGKPTSRSVVRDLMRSPRSTPYVIKAHSIQHENVFVAKVRPASDRLARPSPRP